MRLRRVGLIGDRDDAVAAHRAIPLALAMAAEATGVGIEPVWVPTTQVGDGSLLTDFDGVWCVPASPYHSMDGALSAIRTAREQLIPFLGTCGGFQHAVVEYARNVLGWSDAEHAEESPDAVRPVIVPLACSLVETTDAVHLVDGSILAGAYGQADVAEGYHCRYGLSETFRSAIEGGPLRVSAVDDVGDVRGVELDGHPFFVATLFQHERHALHGRLPPAVHAFAQAINVMD